MDHLVHHRTADGTDNYEAVPTLEAAIARVEALHNEGTSEARVYREVPLAVRTYYRVTLADEGEPEVAGALRAAAGAGAPQTPPPGAMPLSPASGAPAAAGADAAGESGRRAGIFNRS